LRETERRSVFDSGRLSLRGLDVRGFDLRSFDLRDFDPRRLGRRVEGEEGRRFRRFLGGRREPHLPARWQVAPKEGHHLRLFSLNVAHARRNAPNRPFLSRRRAHQNLGEIAQAVRELGPDVVALQEADGPSSWSGNFDHVATLAELANLADHVRGDHNPFGIGRFNLQSGTALLANLPLADVLSHRFAMTWRDTKGFVVGTVTVPSWGNAEIDIVSVHLDFLNPTIRRRQIRRMVDVLAERQRPRVVVGDLNCCWQREPRSMQLLVDALGLRAHEPGCRAPTYPSRRPRRRLDWVLISPELEYSRYQTLHSPLSDHLALVTDLELRA